MTSAPGFGIENLPYGVGVLPDGATACLSTLDGDAIHLGDLHRAGALDGFGLPDGSLDGASLNRFLACGREVWEGVRRRLARLISDGDSRFDAARVPLEAVELRPPVEVGDFVDFYSSLHHATNMGLLLRPGLQPLAPNWRRLPVGYHGRAGSVVGSGTPVVRPHGQVSVGDGPSELRPTARLDYEAEIGFVIGTGSCLGQRIPAGAAHDHIAGLLLVNDWSARDVQAFEYHTLGPFAGKSFATSVSPWLVTLEALEPYRQPAPVQVPPPPAYLLEAGWRWAYDIELEVLVQSEAMRSAGTAPLSVARLPVGGLYWTMPQMLAHATVNGARTRTGDLFASGTVSGPGPGEEGSLMERTRAGERPLPLPDGSKRSFLEDGDTVVIRGLAGGDGRPLVSLGEVAGTVLPALPLEV